MKRVVKIKLKNVFLFLMCLGFVSAILLPSLSFATAFSNGTAFIDWSQVQFLGTGQVVPTLNFLDATGFDTRTTLSSAYGVLNGVETPDGVYNAVSVDGTVVGPAWAGTSVSATQSDASGTVTGSANTALPLTNPSLDQLNNVITTPANQLYASSNITLNGGLNGSPSTGSIDLASAVLTGTFIYNGDGSLVIMAPYALTQSLFASGPGESAQSYVSASMSLLGFDAFGNIIDTPLFQTLVPFYDVAISGPGSYSFSSPVGDILTLTADSLVLGNSYFLEVEATALGSATAVPEPATVLLLASGLAGLGALRKRIWI